MKDLLDLLIGAALGAVLFIIILLESFLAAWLNGGL